MSAPPDYDGPELWGTDKRDGRLVLRERRYKGSDLFLDLRLYVNGGTKPTGKGATIPPDDAPGLADALKAYADARNTGAV